MYKTKKKRIINVFVMFLFSYNIKVGFPPLVQKKGQSERKDPFLLS